MPDDLSPDQLEFIHYMDLATDVTGLSSTKIAQLAGVQPSTVNRPYHQPEKYRYVPKRVTTRLLENVTGLPYELSHAVDAAVRIGSFESIGAPAPGPGGIAARLAAARVLYVDVADDSCDRLYAPGTRLLCAALGAGRQLRQGVSCLVAHYRTGRAAGDVFEYRIMLCFQAAPDGDINLIAPTRDHRKRLAVTLERQAVITDGFADAAAPLRVAQEGIAYVPEGADLAEIIGTAIRVVPARRLREVRLDSKASIVD